MVALVVPDVAMDQQVFVQAPLLFEASATSILRADVLEPKIIVTMTKIGPL